MRNSEPQHRDVQPGRRCSTRHGEPGRLPLQARISRWSFKGAPAAERTPATHTTDARVTRLHAEIASSIDQDMDACGLGRRHAVVSEKDFHRHRRAAYIRPTASATSSPRACLTVPTPAGELAAWPGLSQSALIEIKTAVPDELIESMLVSAMAGSSVEAPRGSQTESVMFRCGTCWCSRSSRAVILFAVLCPEEGLGHASMVERMANPGHSSSDHDGRLCGSGQALLSHLSCRRLQRKRALQRAQ